MWIIGSLNDIGKAMGGISIYTEGTLLGANENGKWNSFIEETWKKIDTNDFSIECINRKGTNQQYYAYKFNLFLYHCIDVITF